MKSILVITLLLAVSQVQSASWAVLVAGSNGYGNYRHQSDVCHAYQTLTEKGLAPEHIITLAYDDIAQASQNPFKGKIFNKPTYEKPGVDVYAGCNIDYKRNDVTPEVFLAVLAGDKDAVKGKGNGRVLETGPNDNIFVFYSDHGSVGLIAFPTKYLYATAMLPVLDKMADQKKFNKFVFYLEACESGSMFQKLKTNTKIYALSASSPSESSWGCYCSPQDIIENKRIGSCLGDLFSVNWMEHSDATDLTQVTLDEQWAVIRDKTTRSKVMQWGDVSYKTDKASDFIGPKKKSSFLRKVKEEVQQKVDGLVDSRDNQLSYLATQFQYSLNNDAFNELQQEVYSRQQYDEFFTEFAKQHRLTGDYYQSNNGECYEKVINSFEHTFGKTSDYGLKYFKYFAEICDNNNLSEEQIATLTK